VGEALSKGGCDIDLPVKSGLYGEAWYAVQTLYRYEHRIARDLTVKGFGTYLPLLRETRQWTDRKKVIEIPAFGGYVFVRHDGSLRNRVRVLETSGIVRMLGDNHAPVPIPDIEIDSLRRMLESNACKKCEYLTVGTMVQVKRGALTGIRGRLVRINNSLRLVLSVSTVSQSVSVEVNLEDVEAAVDTSSKIPSELHAEISGAVPGQFSQRNSDPAPLEI
jgi:transcription antitermination factor NusG